MYHERLARYGATLTTIAALGGLASGCADARPMSAATHPEKVTHVEKDKKIITVPAGVKASTSAEAQMHEVQEAIQHLHRRWDGVLVLHQPTKNAYVSFADSPLSYVAENSDYFVSRKTTETKIICPMPGIERFHGRDYAVVYDTQESKWAFLDVKFAHDMGALDMYAFKGKKPQAVNYPLEAQQADMPVINSPTDYGADWRLMEQTRNDVLLDFWLPTNIDPAAKEYKVIPSKVLPHS